jgi:hypothetical protein
MGRQAFTNRKEWEYAARGLSSGRYQWGNHWKPNAANAAAFSAQRFTDVGSYPEGKTSTGVMDMIGNAWEWTASDLNPYPGSHFSSPVPKAVRVIRGGSWQESKQQATTTYRGFLEMRAPVPARYQTRVPHGIVDPAKQLGKILGVDAIVSGTISNMAPSIRVNARLSAPKPVRSLQLLRRRFSKTSR